MLIQHLVYIKFATTRWHFENSTHVRLALDLEIQKEAKEIVQELNSHGITVIDHPTGDTYLSEEELIQYLLSYECG